jgi:single-strand DNA-binding protein
MVNIMNKVILCGRLTRDPEVRYSQGAEPMAIARYTLAVDRRRAKSNDPNEQTADFISIVAFGKSGEFAEKYLKKGTKMLITGRIQTGSYTNKDGVKVYTTEVVVEDQEFAESKNSASNGTQGNANNAPAQAQNQPAGNDGFMNIPDGIEEELPFN